MSEILRHKSERSGDRTIRHYKAKVTEIDFGTGDKPPVIALANGLVGAGACLGCSDTPCAKKAPEESQLPLGFESFPGDPSQEVCPTQALRWNQTNAAIEIKGDCIGCGLCVVRCPYGAIAFDGKVARVNPPEGSGLLGDITKDAFSGHSMPARKGQIAKSSASALRGIGEALAQLSDTRALLLIRNLFHEIGVQCSIHRKGDTNIRMDAVVAFNDGKTGVVEIEFANAVLESPRALLEDIAVLHGRYHIPIASIVPISVIFALPNGRSEYYQVMEDIRRVLNIHSHTLTVGVMIILMWYGVRLNALDARAFTTTERGADFTKSLVKAIGNERRLDGEPYPGAFATAK